MRATDHDIDKALALRNPHVNIVVSELRELRKQVYELQVNGVNGSLCGLQRGQESAAIGE